jgi:Mg2+/Co2+ transporter CorB
MAHINILWAALIFLVIFSAFFSIAETAYMSVNHYRLRHLVKKGWRSAKRVQLLLERPDRLLGIILLGDTFSDILASSIATLIAVHYFGGAGVFVATVALTFVVLVFGELAPKTIAALYPTPIVLYSSWILWFFLKILYPIVWAINIFSNGVLRLFGFKNAEKKLEHFTVDELRTVVSDASHHVPHRYQNMLLQLLDLEKSCVEDIMVPRNEIVGIDIEKEVNSIIAELSAFQHTRLPVYREHIENILGILHARDALHLLSNGNLNVKGLENILETPYYIPEGTTLNKQLLHFCEKKIRTGLVVDEYGDILGLVTLEDILEEIVGEFTTDFSASLHKDIVSQPDGSFLIEGSINLRALNRRLGTHFSLEGPKTLSGLIIAYVETIPPANTCVKILGYPIEILSVKDNMIKTVRIWVENIN